MTDRHDIAWVIWCARKGFVTKELRLLSPWMRKPDDELRPEDVKEREICLVLADEVIEKAGEITKPVRADVDVLMDSAGDEIWCEPRERMQRRITKWMNVLQRHGPLASMRVSLAGDGVEVTIAEYLELKS